MNDEESLLAQKLADAANLREGNAGHEALAGAFVDVIQGNNPSYILSSAGASRATAINEIFARILPPMLAESAKARLVAQSQIAKRIESIPEILRVPPVPEPTGIASKIAKMFKVAPKS